MMDGAQMAQEGQECVAGSASADIFLTSSVHLNDTSFRAVSGEGRCAAAWYSYGPTVVSWSLGLRKGPY